MSGNIRRAVIIFSSILSGGTTASNTADREWFLAGLFAVLTIIGLMSFWWALTYEEAE